MRFRHAGLLVTLTLIANISANPEQCVCHHFNRCIILNANSSTLRDTEMHCPAKIQNMEYILIVNFMEKSLPLDTLDGYTNLNSAEFWQGSIQHIQPGAFEKLSNLTKLQIRRNNIRTLENNTFRGLDALEILDMHCNSLTSIAPYAFDGLKKLAQLTLSCNQLTELPPTVFSTLTTLKSLFLQENLLTHLPDSLFDNKELYGVHLAHNRLESFNFPHLKVTKLYLHNNSLTSLNVNDHVKLLQAHCNRIRTIEGTGRSLSEIWLKDNAISDVTSIVRLTNLKMLILSNNPLQPNSVFSSLTNLEGLLLRNTSIQISESTFANLSSMTLLDLSYNNLTQLDFRMFSSMTELETLIVAHNRIQMINFIELREFLPKLRIFEICNNGWNTTYNNRILLRMKHHKLLNNWQSLPTLLLRGLFVDLCTTKTNATSASIEESDYSSEDVSDTLEQQFDEYYPTSSPTPASSQTSKPIHTSSTTKTRTTPPKKESAMVPTVAVILNTAVDVVPGDQQLLVNYSPLFIAFQVAMCTLSIACLAVLGYYVHQKRLYVRGIAPVDATADSVPLV